MEKLSAQWTEEELKKAHSNTWLLVECIRTACQRIKEKENTIEKLYSDRERYEYTAKFLHDAGFKIETYKNVDF